MASRLIGVREVAAATLLLVVLAGGALAPALWQNASGGAALASGGPLSTQSPAPPSWKARDSGLGFVVCAKDDVWSRPSLADENAHLAADPRYAGVRADDSHSMAWSPFHMGAVLYEGSSSADQLIALTGLWRDPRIAAATAACASAEPQVWLMGYAASSYWADDRLISELRVVPASGYQLVVITGPIRPRLVVADNMKVAVLQMPAAALTPTPTPPPKPSISRPLPTVQPYTPAPSMPVAATPVGLVLPRPCVATEPTHSRDGVTITVSPGNVVTPSSTMTWVVRCPNTKTDLIPGLIRPAFFAQGWLEGQLLSGGVHEFFKDDLEMDVRFQDPAGFPTDRILMAERYVCCSVPTPPPSPAPIAFVLPRGCGIYANGIGIRTGQNGETIHWIATCPPMRADDLAVAFAANVVAQGWAPRDWTPRRATYRHPMRDIELVLEFSDGYVWFAETGTVIAALPRSTQQPAAPTVPVRASP
jgi:hypothetical protein